MQEHKEEPAARQQSESASPAETNTSPPIPSRRRVLALGRGIPLLIFILAAAVCLFLGGRWLQYYLGHASTDDARVKGDLIKISSAVQGKIRLLPIQEGEHVKKGQLIAQLREEDYQASVDEAEGAMRAIQGELSEAQEEEAESEVEQNRVKLELGKVNPSDVISKQNRVETLKGRLKEAAAVLEAARLKLAHTCVTSPIDGVIAKKVGNLGEVVKPGQPIAIVVDLANLWVEANLEETKIEQVRWGQAVDLAVDAYPGKKFKGKVVNIGAAASSEFALIPENRSAGNFTKVTQRIPVKIEVIDPVRQLRPGMMVEAAIKTNGGKIVSDNEAVAQVPDHAK